MGNPRVIGQSLLLRAGVLVATAAALLLNTRVLGAEGQGQIAVFQLGLLLIASCCGFIAGGAVVYLQQRWPLRTMWRAGHLWIAACTFLGSLTLGAIGGFPYVWAIALAAWLQAGIVFHGQILLAANQIRSHNRLAFEQTAVLTLFLAASYGAGWHSLEAFIASLFGALILTSVDAFLAARKQLEPHLSQPPNGVWSDLWKFGRAAQTGALLQLLSNRLPFGWLARAGSHGTAQAGLYAVAFYGMEAMWTAARALAPVLHARTAREPNREYRLANTRGFALLTAGIGIGLWLVALAIPESLYHAMFQIAGIREVIVHLGPAIAAGSVAGLFAHHLSGIGQHRWNAWTSGASLATIVLLGTFWYTTKGAIGAAMAASVAGIVQILGLAMGLHREEHMRLLEWIPRKSDWAQLSSSKSDTPITRADSNPSA